MNRFYIFLKNKNVFNYIASRKYLRKKIYNHKNISSRFCTFVGDGDEYMKRNNLCTKLKKLFEYDYGTRGQ